jgi:hypothetical protein
MTPHKNDDPLTTADSHKVVFNGSPGRSPLKIRVGSIEKKRSKMSSVAKNHHDSLPKLKN